MVGLGTESFMHTGKDKFFMVILWEQTLTQLLKMKKIVMLIEGPL